MDVNEAIVIGKQKMPDADTCTEYESAYLFSVSNDKSFGGTSPLVISKQDGKCLPFVAALGEGLIDGDKLNQIAI